MIELLDSLALPVPWVGHAEKTGHTAYSPATEAGPGEDQPATCPGQDLGGKLTHAVPVSRDENSRIAAPRDHPTKGQSQACPEIDHPWHRPVATRTRIIQFWTKALGPAHCAGLAVELLLERPVVSSFAEERAADNTSPAILIRSQHFACTGCI